MVEQYHSFRSELLLYTNKKQDVTKILSQIILDRRVSVINKTH